MEIRKLRHAVTLARLLNFTRAAEALNITQSALSRSIQTLERECGGPLFERNRGAVALTAAGREFIHHAEALLRNQEALQDMVVHASQGEGGHVTLGVIPLAARIILAPVLATRVSSPNFHAQVIIGSSQRLLPMILQETIDLGICMTDTLFDNSPFASMTLAELSLAVIVRKDHPLTRLAAFGAEEMARYPLVRATPVSFDGVLPVMLGLRQSIPPALTIEDFDVLNQMVIASDAVWVTSPIAARQGIAKGELVALPIAWLPQTRLPLVAYWLRQRTLSPLTRSLLEQFRRFGAELSSS